MPADIPETAPDRADDERRCWLCEKCGAGGFVDEGPNTVRCNDDECPIMWAFRDWNPGAQTAGSPVSDADAAGAAAGDEGRATQPRQSGSDADERWLNAIRVRRGWSDHYRGSVAWGDIDVALRLLDEARRERDEARAENEPPS